MTSYIGPLGALAPFDCPVSNTGTSERLVSYRRTIGGRVKVQWGAAARRSWSVSLDEASPAETANLRALELGAFGPPPWVWVDPWIQVTNLFTPEQSMPGQSNRGEWSGDAQVGGGLRLPDGGVALETLASNGGAVTFGYIGGLVRRVPVVPGRPVTGAVFLSGSGTANVTIAWYGPGDTFLSNTLAVHTIGGSLQRKHVTGVAPAGATEAWLRVTGAAGLALPSMTWTPDLAEWTPGNGVRSVVVEGLSEAVLHAVAGAPSLRRSSMSFTVREVG